MSIWRLIETARLRGLNGSSLMASGLGAWSAYTRIWIALFPLEIKWLRTVLAVPKLTVALQDNVIVMYREQDVWINDGRSFSIQANISDAKGRVLRILLPAQAVFRRTVRLPRTFEASLPQALDADLRRRTPIDLTDVITDYRIIRREGDSLVIRQWIVRRGELAPFAEAASIARSVHIVTRPVEDDEGFEPRLRLPDGPGFRAAGWQRRLLAALLALAAILLTAHGARSIFSRYWVEHNLDDTLREIQPQLSSAKINLENIKLSRDGSVRFIQWRNTSLSFTRLWDDLSTAIPPDAWLNEFAFESGGSIPLLRITGYARSAADVVRALDLAGMFSGTKLEGAVTFDPVAEAERFTIVTRPIQEAKRS